MGNKKVIGFKGFDKDLKCRDFQYSIGETYETEEVELGEKGFHFCENPFNVFSYYPPSRSRYCTVEAGGEIKSETDGEKSVCSRITIGAELHLYAFIKTGVKFLLDRVGKKNTATNTGDYSAATNTGVCSAATNTGSYSVATNTGDYSAATNTGNRSAATNTGSYSAATNTGDYSAATVKGIDSIAIVTGKYSKARGALGCWIVLTEHGEWSGKAYPILDVKAFKVDGVTIKADTYYQLVNGEAKEVNDGSETD